MKPFFQVRKSQDIGYVLTMSLYFAHQRGTAIRVDELIAGLYVGCFDRLFPYFVTCNAS